MNKNVLKHVIRLFGIEAIFLLIFAFLVQVIQSNFLVRTQREDLARGLKELPQLIAQEQQTEAANEAAYDQVFISKTRQAAYMVTHLDSFSADRVWLNQVAHQLQVEELHLMKSDGTVFASSTNPVLPLTIDHLEANGSNCVETVRDITYRCYAQKAGEYYVVLRVNAAELLQIERLTSSTEESLSGITMGLNGLVMALDDSGTVLYTSNNDLIQLGTNAFQSGLNRSELKEENQEWVRLNNGYYMMGFRYFPTERYWIGLGIPNARIQNQVMASVGILVFCAFCILSVFNAYMVFLFSDAFKNLEKTMRDAEESNTKVDPDEVMTKLTSNFRKKLTIILIVSGLIAFLLASYVQSLSLISIRTQANHDDLTQIRLKIQKSQENVEVLRGLYEKYYINKVMTASFILGQQKSLWNKDDLAELSAAMDTEYTIIFDKDGNEVVTDTYFVGIAISDDPGSQTYALRKLMFGYPYVLTDPAIGEYSGEIHQDIGAVILTDGEYDGFLVMSAIPGRLEEALASAKLESTLKSIQSSQGGFVFAVDKKDNTFNYYPNANYIGKEVTQYGLKVTEIRDAFNGFIRIFEKDYYASTMETDDLIIVYTVNAASVLTNGIYLFALQIDLLIFIALFILAWISARTVKRGMMAARRWRFKKKKDAETGEEEEVYEPMVDVVMPDGTVKQTVAIWQRLSLRGIEWESLNPEQKIRMVLNGYLIAFAIFATVILLAKERVFQDNSIILYILNKEWERGINIFSLTHCAITGCIIFVAHYLIMKLLALLPQITSPKGETVIRLIRSLVKYISVLTALFLCLSYLGIDSATLLASAGLFTLVIGFGAQTLVSDILSGLFIIFEGEFQVGDIVTIDGFRGTVQEIGIRTTKIMSAGGDIKIIRNTNVNNVLNMTRKDSKALCSVQIEYGADLDKTIEIFEKELPGMKERNPSFLTDPVFAGVSELGDNGVSLLFITTCTEKDRFAATYSLNRELKRICEKYNINIPFPQMVVHQGED